MAASRRTITLTAEHAAFIDAEVAAGHYASADDVVREALDAFCADDAEVEAWLHREVVPAYDEIKRNPAIAIPIDDVFAAVRAQIADRATVKVDD